MSAPGPVSVHQLKIVLRDVSPMVWRRLLVRSDTTLLQLHRMIQVAMGWEARHPHRFRIHGKDYTPAPGGGITDAGAPTAAALADFRLRPGERFSYTYDFGAWWQHDLRLEQVLPRDPTGMYPVCIGGKQACPPEECGGPDGYRALLREQVSLAALDDLGLIAEAVRRFLEDGERGTADERARLEAALGRAKERAWDAPRRFDRRAINVALAGLNQGAAA